MKFIMKNIKIVSLIIISLLSFSTISTIASNSYDLSLQLTNKITKVGGKKHLNGTVTYYRAKKSGEIGSETILCSGKGPNPCPEFTKTNSNSITNIVNNEVLDGNYSGTSYFNGVRYSWSGGSISDEGCPEYVLIIEE